MNPHLNRPAGLTEAGNLAHEIIVRFLEERGMSNTGLPDGSYGIFHCPEDWAQAGETYGHDSVLIVTHDGGDHAQAFDWNRERYGVMEDLRVLLSPHGLYMEQCTAWYSACYHQPTTEQLVKEVL